MLSLLTPVSFSRVSIITLFSDSAKNDLTLSFCWNYTTKKNRKQPV